jgi:hypothetical protein
MDTSFLSGISSTTIVVVLVLLMVFFYWFAFKITAYLNKKSHGIEIKHIGTIQGSLLGLLALILAFTFNMSVTRYDQRREVVIEEANDIGTAILRSDLYPDSSRAEFRKDFKEYVEARILYYEARTDIKTIQTTLDKSDIISKRIWKRAALLSLDPNAIVRSNQMIPALNSMIDVVTSRDALRTANVPDAVLWLLFSLCLIGSFVVGLGSNQDKISWIVIWSFAIMMAVSVYFVLDLDRPRQGIITNDAPHQKMLGLRKMLD